MRSLRAGITGNGLLELTESYGFVNTFNGGNTPLLPTAGAQPRSGQIVARFTF